MGEGVVGNFWQEAGHRKGIFRETTVADYELAQPHWRTVLISDSLAQAEGRNWVWEGMDCDPATRTRCLVKLSEGGEDATVREFDRTTGQFVPGGFVSARQAVYVVGGRRYAAGVAGMAAGGDDGLRVSLRRQAVDPRQPLDQAVEVARGDRLDALATAGSLLDNGAGRRLSLVARRPSFHEVQFSLLGGAQPVRLALPPKADLEGMVGNQVMVSLQQDWTVDKTVFRTGSLVSLDADEMMRDPLRLRPTVVYAPGRRRCKP